MGLLGNLFGNKAKTPAKKEKTILEQYREGLQYLNGCSGVFTEEQLREFNRIIGNRFPEAEIESLLSKSKLMLRGMDEIKKTLKDNMSEGIAVFEQLEKSGVDLSAYAGKI
jgi:hypothetical protein